MRRDSPNQGPAHVSFCKVYPDGSFVKLIVYVNDKLFFGNNEATLQEFKDKLAKRFDVEFLGQAHWYLSARIHQDADFNVTLDQARYCKAIVNRFLKKAGAKKKTRFHSTILPAEFVPIVEDCSKDEELILPHVLEPCYICLKLDQTLLMR
jgi:hypothetical protein